MSAVYSGHLVSLCIEPSQPQRVISGLTLVGDVPVWAPIPLCNPRHRKSSLPQTCNPPHRKSSLPQTCIQRHRKSSLPQTCNLRHRSSLPQTRNLRHRKRGLYPKPVTCDTKRTFCFRPVALIGVCLVFSSWCMSIRVRGWGQFYLFSSVPSL